MSENFNPAADHGNPAQGHINYRHITVLGQLPWRKIASTLNLTLTQTLTLTRGQLSSSTPLVIC